MRDINVRRARLFNGWLLVSGRGRGTVTNPTIESVIRCNQVYAWSYQPTSPAVTVELPGDTITLWGTDDVPAQRIDDLLWQGCVAGSDGSPLRSAERRARSMVDAQDVDGRCQLCMEEAEHTYAEHDEEIAADGDPEDGRIARAEAAKDGAFDPIEEPF